MSNETQKDDSDFQKIAMRRYEYGAAGFAASAALLGFCGGKIVGYIAADATDPGKDIAVSRAVDAGLINKPSPIGKSPVEFYVTMNEWNETQKSEEKNPQHQAKKSRADNFSNVGAITGAAVFGIPTTALFFRVRSSHARREEENRATAKENGAGRST